MLKQRNIICFQSKHCLPWRS